MPCQRTRSARSVLIDEAADFAEAADSAGAADFAGAADSKVLTGQGIVVRFCSMGRR